MTKREVIRMALDVLSGMEQNYGNLWQVFQTPEELDGICNALRAELAKPELEPVVWMQSTHLDKFEQHACGADSMLARCSHRKIQSDYVPLFRKEDL